MMTDNSVLLNYRKEKKIRNVTYAINNPDTLERVIKCCRRHTLSRTSERFIFELLFNFDV